MQWTGEGLIIGVRRHGETSVIAEVMVEGRGRHLGLVRGGRSSKLAATLQPGNIVQLTWRARLEEHLYLVDPMGHWMMRFPARLDREGAAKAKRDLERLMRASASWDKAGRPQ